MDLQDLPQFEIAARLDDRANELVHLVGRLSHLRGVRNPFGALYISAFGSVLGQLDLPTTPESSATMHAAAWSVPANLGVGETLPWLDGYWEPEQIERVLDAHHEWTPKLFIPEAAQHFELNGVHGWQQVGTDLPEGARALEIRSGDWDHEHCDLCRSRIGAGGVPEGYVDPTDHWLCPDCYTRYALEHDISFALDA